MGMFDKIKGRFKKGGDSTQPSDESFDLDDDALFAGDSLGGEAVGTDDFGAFDSGGDELDAFDSGGGGEGDDFGAFDSGGGFDTGDDGGFGTLEEGGDLGAAQTADFDDIGDIGEAPGDFGDDFGDEFAEPEETGKKGKKKKKAKARGGGAGKVVAVTVGAGVVGLVIGLGVGMPVGGIISGNAAKEAQLIEKIEQNDAMKAKLRPLKNSMPLNEVEVWRAELEKRRAFAKEIEETTALVADLDAQEQARDDAQALLTLAQQRLAVRTAELKNIQKQAGQIDARIAYLQQRGTHLAEEAAAMDAHVEHVQKGLPDAYAGEASEEATRVLNVRNIGSGSAAE